MEQIGSLAYTKSSGSVDFMLYNTIADTAQVQWVFWRRGISSHEIRNHLFEARVVLDWDGVDYTYDFKTGRYTHLRNDPEVGWIEPDICVDHSGGIIAKFCTQPDPDLESGQSEPQISTLSTLRDLVLDSESPLKLETRSRPTAAADWHTRSNQLLVKRAEDPNVGTREMTRKVAVAA